MEKVYKYYEIAVSEDCYRKYIDAVSHKMTTTELQALS